MKGVNGARSCAVVSRHSRRVAKAAPSPSQKRRRERRTYQFERSSTKAAMARPAVVASKSSSRSVTSATVALSRDRAQRSSSVSSPVDLRLVGAEEGVRVPELAQEQAHALADRVGREAVAVPRLLRREEVPAEGVGPEAVEDLPGDDDVALGLRHLLALAVEDQAEADDVLVGRAVEEQDGDRQQRVEPPARLVERLADEVRREAAREAVLVLERRVLLREGHRARSRTRRR